MPIITDIKTWILNSPERIFRFNVYKKMFTPYETQRAFIDESIYEDDHYRFAIIAQAIDLGNSEWLLGLQEIIDNNITDHICYYKLNEINLEYFEYDQDILLDNEKDNTKDEDHY